MFLILFCDIFIDSFDKTPYNGFYNEAVFQTRSNMNMFHQLTITDICAIFTVSSPKGRSARIENRSSYGLSFCSEGKITYTIHGKQAVSDKNHAVILPKDQTYSLYGDRTGVFPVINFLCQDFICNEVLSLPIQNPGVYLKDFEKMKALSLFEENRAKIMSIFYDMLHRLSLESSLRNTIVPAIRYLEQNYQNQRLTNAMLAGECNISEVYFRKIFADIYKCTPKQYILDIRISKAKQLLSENRLKIAAVAELCGFSNQYHFCRIFKERTGYTPTEYMKQNHFYKI